MTDDQWRMIDHSANVALAHAWQWAGTARTQAVRVVEGCGSRHEIPDAFLLVVAIRHVRRAANMALEDLTSVAAKTQLRAALGDFDAALPGVRDARNVLEHFDDYSRGVGDLQQPATSKQRRIADEELAQRYQVHLEHLDNDPSRPLLRVGPYAIDLPQAARAASVLMTELWAAIKTDEGEPVNRQAIAAFLE